MNAKATALNIALEDAIAQAVKEFEARSGYIVKHITVDHLGRGQIMISTKVKSRRATA